jgi:hypothetical protein
MINRRTFALSTIVALPLLAEAQTTTISRSAPTLDRWNYPFNGAPGTRNAAPVFGVIGDEMLQGFTFDQRDAQFLIGFDLLPELDAAPCELDRLRVTQATVTVTVLDDLEFTYDPTQDDYTTYLEPTDPDFTPDPDAGRPIMLFGVDYRNGFDQASFSETSPFGPVAWEARNAFPIDFDQAGLPRDVSNNVSGSPTGVGPLAPFSPSPFAVGSIASVAPGALVPANAVVTFELDVDDDDIQGYLQSALASGELRVMLTSLQPATFDTLEGSYATFYTKENIFGAGRFATLELTVECVAPCLADIDGSGSVDFQDFLLLSGQFGQSGPNLSADLDESGSVDFQDFLILSGEFGQTGC